MPSYFDDIVNRPYRTEEEARRDIRLSQAYSEERQRHSVELARDILDHAFERVYSDDGKWIGYRDMQGRLFDCALNERPILGEVE